MVREDHRVKSFWPPLECNKNVHFHFTFVTTIFSRKMKSIKPIISVIQPFAYRQHRMVPRLYFYYYEDATEGSIVGYHNLTCH